MGLIHDLETAAAAYAATLTFSAERNILKGEEDSEKKLPNVICNARETTNEIPPQSGNFTHKLRVELNTEGDDITQANHAADAKILEDAFNASDLGALLMAASPLLDLFIYDPRISYSYGKDVYENGWGFWMEIELLCCHKSI